MKGDIKDCSDCIFPHCRENYGYIVKRYQDLKEITLSVDKQNNND